MSGDDRNEESVTLRLGELHAGRAEAAERLWRRYAQRLVRRARRKPAFARQEGAGSHRRPGLVEPGVIRDEWRRIAR